MTDGNLNTSDINPEGFFAFCDSCLDFEDYEPIRAVIKKYSSAEIIETLLALNNGKCQQFLANLLNPEILANLPIDLKLEAIRTIGLDQCIQLLQYASGAKIYMFLEGLEAEIQQYLLSRMPKETKAVVEELLSYPDCSAGRLIDKDYILLPSHLQVGQVIDMLSNHRRGSARSFYHLFVVDSFLHPVGIVSAADLLCEVRSKLVADVVSTDFKVIASGADQEEVVRMFQHHALFSLAVVDEQNCIVGVIYADEVIDIVQEEAGEDLMHLGGVSESDANYRIWRTSLKRVLWLFVSFIAINCASLVVGAFGEVLNGSIELVALMPIIAAMGGNAGLQATTVSVRSLLIRDQSPKPSRLIYKEFIIGLINGSILAGFMFVIIILRFNHYKVAAAFSLSMICLFTVSTVVGAAIPNVLDKLNLDPSLSSSVLTSAVTDIVALYILLKISTLVLT